MRKAIVALAFLAVALLIHPAAAHASGSTVNLLTPTTGTITFTPGAGTTDMTVTGITGTAIGTGSLSGGTSYSLSGNLVFTATGPQDYAATGTLSFTVNGGSLLTGTLSGVTAEQVGKLLILTGNLSVSSGTSGITGGQVALVIDLPSATPLSGLTGAEMASLSVGEGVGSVTPEPGTMVLFGSGILVFAGLVRRKRTSSAS
ncbi:MAG: PEP-CTERM sorting domain-containing protein [Candidatus Acidiferrales bacterium]